MNPATRQWVLAWAGSLLALNAFAAESPPDEAQRRERLSAERAAVQSRHDAAVIACEKAFAVTDCMTRAKSERRGALDRIAREEASLDDAQRRRRAEERRQRIAEKQKAVAARAAASAPDVRLRSPRLVAPAAGSAPRPSRRAEPRKPEVEAEEAAAAKRRAEQAQKRRERAAAHEESVRQRNEKDRATGKPPAAPLPVPQASLPGR